MKLEKSKIKEKGVMIRYLMILCCFKILVLPVVILLQIEQELVRNTPIKEASSGSFKTLKYL